ATEVREFPGEGVQASVDGVPLRLGSAAFCGLPAPAADASAQVHLAGPDGWLASFDLDETLRPGAAEAVAALGQAGLQVELLSGDQPAAVRRLADRAGIAASA